MIYLPDTNACIRYPNPVDSALARKMRAIAPQDITLCGIVKMELYYGTYRSSRQADHLALLQRFFAAFRSLPFDDTAAEFCGRIRAVLALGSWAAIGRLGNLGPIN